MLFDGGVECLKRGMTDHVRGANFFLDCMTVPWILVERAPVFRSSSWLSPAYMRIYRVVTEAHTLSHGKALDWLPEMGVKLATTALEFVGVIIFLAGTMFTIELLGHTRFDDVYYATEMGDISFFQMIYFTFITMSTVGYEDTGQLILEHEGVVETPAEAPAADPSLSLFTAATPYKDVTLELSQNNDDFHDTGDDVTEAKLSALDAALRLP